MILCFEHGTLNAGWYTCTSKGNIGKQNGIDCNN